jgi:hypothetical protein
VNCDLYLFNLDLKLLNIGSSSESPESLSAAAS